VKWLREFRYYLANRLFVELLEICLLKNLDPELQQLYNQRIAQIPKKSLANPGYQ
jgi:hypothetical protein